MNRSYKLSLNNSHPNLYSITLNDGKCSISIEQIREMIKFANKSSFNNQYKIILINKSEFLNKSSSNAILKILEEPSKNTIFLILPYPGAVSKTLSTDGFLTCSIKLSSSLLTPVLSITVAFLMPYFL